MKPETDFTETTNDTREQWTDRLDWLSSLLSGASPSAIVHQD
jgi:hypothetical protein